VNEDEHPELAGYEPVGDKPLRSPHLLTAMRIVVVLGLVGLILPGILISVTTANRTADTSCAVYARYYAPESVGFSARFEVMSAAGMGWNCYALSFGGEEVLVATLGIIPGAPRIPAVPATET